MMTKSYLCGSKYLSKVNVTSREEVGAYRVADSHALQPCWLNKHVELSHMCTWLNLALSPGGQLRKPSSLSYSLPAIISHCLSS